MSQQNKNNKNQKSNDSKSKSNSKNIETTDAGVEISESDAFKSRPKLSKSPTPSEGAVGGGDTEDFKTPTKISQPLTIDIPKPKFYHKPAKTSLTYAADQQPSKTIISQDARNLQVALEENDEKGKLNDRPKTLDIRPKENEIQTAKKKEIKKEKDIYIHNPVYNFEPPADFEQTQLQRQRDSTKSPGQIDVLPRHRFLGRSRSFGFPYSPSSESEEEEMGPDGYKCQEYENLVRTGRVGQIPIKTVGSKYDYVGNLHTSTHPKPFLQYNLGGHGMVRDTRGRYNETLEPIQSQKTNFNPSRQNARFKKPEETKMFHQSFPEHAHYDFGSHGYNPYQSRPGAHTGEHEETKQFLSSFPEHQQLDRGATLFHKEYQSRLGAHTGKYEETEQFLYNFPEHRRQDRIPPRFHGYRSRPGAHIGKHEETEQFLYSFPEHQQQDRIPPWLPKGYQSHSGTHVGKHEETEPFLYSFPRHQQHGISPFASHNQCLPLLGAHAGKHEETEQFLYSFPGHQQPNRVPLWLHDQYQSSHGVRFEKQEESNQGLHSFQEHGQADIEHEQYRSILGAHPGKHEETKPSLHDLLEHPSFVKGSVQFTGRSAHRGEHGGNERSQFLFREQEEPGFGNKRMGKNYRFMDRARYGNQRETDQSPQGFREHAEYELGSQAFASQPPARQFARYGKGHETNQFSHGSPERQDFKYNPPPSAHQHTPAPSAHYGKHQETYPFADSSPEHRGMGSKSFPSYGKNEESGGSPYSSRRGREHGRSGRLQGVSRSPMKFRTVQLPNPQPLNRGDKATFNRILVEPVSSSDSSEGINDFNISTVPFASPVRDPYRDPLPNFDSMRLAPQDAIAQVRPHLDQVDHILRLPEEDQHKGKVNDNEEWGQTPFNTPVAMRPSVKPLPKNLNFSGVENWNTFKNRFKLFLKQNRIFDEESAIFHFTMALTGAAADFLSRMSDNANFQSLAQIFKIMEERYSDSKLAQSALVQFQCVSQEPNEDVKTWGYRVWSLAYSAYPTLSAPEVERLAVLRFCLALNDKEAARHLAVQNFQNMSAAIKAHEIFSYAQVATGHDRGQSENKMLQKLSEKYPSIRTIIDNETLFEDDPTIRAISDKDFETWKSTSANNKEQITFLRNWLKRLSDRFYNNSKNNTGSTGYRAMGDKVGDRVNYSRERSGDKIMSRTSAKPEYASGEKGKSVVNRDSQGPYKKSFNQNIENQNYRNASKSPKLTCFICKSEEHLAAKCPFKEKNGINLIDFDDDLSEILEESDGEASPKEQGLVE